MPETSVDELTSRELRLNIVRRAAVFVLPPLGLEPAD
jgi:hypothetical protein